MKFFRFILLILIGWSLFSCAATDHKETVAASDNLISDQSRNEKIAKLNEPVFGISIMVKGKVKESKYSVGTGFLIGDGLLASALHVQSRAEELAKKFNPDNSQTVGWKKLKTGEDVEFPIEMLAFDKENDLAIYRFDSQTLQKNPKFSTIKPLKLAENQPSIGAAVVSVGYYGNYKHPFNSIGNVAMIDENEDIFSDLTLMPGNSGAPVCDLETGEVVGVTTDVLDLGNETVRYGIAKSAAKLRALLARL